MRLDDDDRTRIRAAFPALRSETVFLENAGGSQLPAAVIEAMRRYMSTSYVQLGAGYAESRRATAVVEDAHGLVSQLVNGEAGHVILGASTSALLRMLSDCYRDVLVPGDEIIVAETGHEANVGNWTRLERHGLTIRWWRMDPERHGCPVETLEPLLNARTAIVAFPHVSNLIGHIEDVTAITAAAHAVGARVVVDGVAYAPHRAIDVTAWDVDWYAYSTYKVYGPHMGALYGRRDAVEALTGPNHFFIPKDEIPYAFELGGASHEGCAGILALSEYLGFLASLAPNAEAAGAGAICDRHTIETAFDVMTACELPVQEALLAYLRGKPDVRIIGPEQGDASRVGTVSFVHASRPSREIVEAVDAAGIGIRNGHMYAYHLCRALGLDVDEGVVRTSLVHYNTVSEIEQLIDVLDRVL